MVSLRLKGGIAAPGGPASSCKPVARRCAHQQQQQQQKSGPAPQRSACSCAALPQELLQLAGTDPAVLQDVIVGGSVAAAVGVALVSGLKKDPTPCELCQGTGGIKCFACEGEGNKLTKRDALEGARPKRDFVGRVSNSRACRVCGGNGLVLCSQCKGSGYTTKL